MRLRYILIGGILLTILIGLAVSGAVSAAQEPPPTPTLSPDAEVLRDLFYSPECQLPCFMELEPGVTTLAELEAILTQHAIPYMFDPGDEGNGFLQWLPDGSQTFVGDGAFEFGVTVTIANNLVWHMIIPLNAPVQSVQEVFGNPQELRWNTDDTDYYLIYPDIGLAFQVDSFYSSERTHLLVSTIVDNPWAIIVNPLGELVNQPCPTYGTPPCIVPTATPTPTALSEAEQLRDLLSDPRCQNACYDGIEPGVMTQTELEARLMAEHIDFEFIEDIPGTSSGVYYWHRDLSEPFQHLSPSARLAIGAGEDWVIGMNIPVHIPLSTMIEAFGYPSVVRNGGGSSYYLIYETERLLFNLNKSVSTTHVNGIRIVSALGESNIIDEPLIPSVNQPCPTYGTPPCIAPTATPTPTILPTNTPAREP